MKTSRQPMSIDQKLQKLRRRLKELGSVLVCYSGGVDSALVLAVAHEVLGDKAIGMTAVSPSLSPAEQEAAVSVAAHMGADHRLVETLEIDNEQYAANAPDRCFYCKSELYRTASQKRREWNLAAILNGTNIDDFGDHRPGLQAAKEAGVLSLLVEFEFRKQDVRDAAQQIGLEVWNKKAAACLSSRIPYGTRVTRQRLKQIHTFEAALSAMKFERVRVRYHDELARIELDLEDLERAAQPGTRAEIVAAGRQAGFAYITLDLVGYRTGSHNEVLAGRSLPVLS